MWYAYSINAIDFEWENLKTVKDTIAKFTAEANKVIQSPFVVLSERLHKATEFVDSWVSAQEAAKAVGWEGDFRHDPVVFWIPHEYQFAYGFVIKLDNNGQCFVISPMPMFHLAHEYWKLVGE